MIKGAKTIEQFKKMQKVEQWIDGQFNPGSIVEWKLVNDDKEVWFKDRVGDTMTLAISDIIK